MSVLIRKILQERILSKSLNLEESEELKMTKASKDAVEASKKADDNDDWELHQKAGSLHFFALKDSNNGDRKYHAKMIKYHLDRMNEYE